MAGAVRDRLARVGKGEVERGVLVPAERAVDWNEPVAAESASRREGESPGDRVTRNAIGQGQRSAC